MHIAIPRPIPTPLHVALHAEGGEEEERIGDPKLKCYENAMR